MTINANFPLARPSLLLDFANSQELDPRITFSRPTTATYYDGVSSALAEQNLLLQSNTFTNAAWVATNGTVASGVTDPAGGTTAFSFTATAANATLYQTLTLTATPYTNSFWIQRVTGTGTINLTLDGTTLNPVTITGSWAKYQSTATPTAGSHTIGIQVTTSGDVINIFGSQLENRSSATATNITTTTALNNYIPVLQTAASNQARFDHDPVARTSLGFLIEQQSTNLILQSQSYNTSWTLTNATLTSGANIAPDGTQTAFNLVDSTATGLQAISQTVTKAASAIAYTDAQYFKANTRTYSWMQLSDGAGNGAIVYFNLSTGAISTAVAGVGTAFTALSATINPVGNGWYRCTLSATSNTATSIVKQFGSSTNGTSNSFTGNGYSGIYIWGSQLEALAFSTSYIPTVASQVTRSADIANMTGNNFSSWFNIAQGTYYVEFNVLQNTQSIPILANSNGNPILYQQGPNFGFYDGTNQGGGYVGAISLNTFYKGAISMTPSTNTLSLSGTSGSAFTTNGKFLSQPNLQIGYGYNSPQSFVGHFKKIAYYPLALPAANLQALTGS